VIRCAGRSLLSGASSSPSSGKIIDERILLGTLEWFVAAIAFNTLGSLPFVKKR
jgi:hypothetical protein